MYNFRKIDEDLYRIGVSDRKLTIFEAIYPLTHGVAYNSYVITDEKTALIDTVDEHCAKQFFKNLKAVLNGKKLDYIIVQHMEPDHAGLIDEVLSKYPDVEVVCSQKASDMMKQFFTVKDSTKFNIIKENDTLNLGKHELHFVSAPMVHWPEVMLTYDSTNKTLFSADAFGSFGSVNGNISDKEASIDENYIDEARRYYTNIVGKYGVQVQNVLKKASTLDIKRICPLHGLIVEENIAKFVEKYDKWSKYEPEEKGVVIAYSSIYGGTENAMEVLATKLAENGVKNIKMYDTSMTHNSYILAEMFKYSHVVLAGNTYNNGIFVTMDNLIQSIVAHGLKNRKYALIQNGTWVANCGNSMKESILKLAGSEIINENLTTIKSTLQENQMDEIETLAKEIADSINA